jgi:microcin C transport system substrate-binding protein
MFVLLVLLVYPALTKAQDLTKAHGFNFFGELKYPADFQHLDYVNPDAPKGVKFRSGPRVHLIR